MEPAASITNVAGNDDDLVQEISPVRSKIANLANRSSFASFFLKNKKNISKLKNDLTIKDDPSENLDFKANDTKVDPFKTLNDAGMKIGNEELYEKLPSVIIDNQIKSFGDQSKPCENSADIKQHFSYPPTEDVTIISETKAVRKTRKPSNETFVISDSEPVNLIDSDIEIILPRRSQRSKKTKLPADIECISVSSEDGDRKIITDLRRSSRISGTTPSTPIIPLSDYSNMKKPDFTRPVSKPAENIFISDSPGKATAADVKPITITLNPPKSPFKPQPVTVNTSIRSENINPPTSIDSKILPCNNSMTKSIVTPVLSLSATRDCNAPTLERTASTKKPATKVIGSTAPNGNPDPVATLINTANINPSPVNHITLSTINNPATMASPVQTTINPVYPKPAIIESANDVNLQVTPSILSVDQAGKVPNFPPAVPATLSTQLPAYNLPVTATQVLAKPASGSVNHVPASSVDPFVNQAKIINPVVPRSSQMPSKPSYVPVNRNPAPSNSSTINTSPIKQKSTSSYIPRNFNDLDPSLREELMNRLSQREHNSSAGNPNAPGINITTTKTATASNTRLTQTSDKFAIFNIIQRLIPGTFDATKSATGKLLPSTSFTIIFKTSDTFGSLKSKIAEILRISPFDLVLTQDSGGAGQSELFDTTRPSTLSIIGKTVEEYDRLKVNLRCKQLPAEKPSKKVSVNAQNNATGVAPMTAPPNNSATAIFLSQVNRKPLPSASTIITAPTVSQPTTTQASSTLGVLPTESPSQVIPPSLINRLYIYTKSSYTLYKSLLKTKKQQVYDSLTFLQTADEEMYKFSQDPVNKEDEDLLDSMDMKMSQSQAIANLITVNVKTANSRNQSHPIKISSTATIAQLLQSFATEYKITGTRLIFDGDVLRDTETIGNILEDDDMVEIK